MEEQKTILFKGFSLKNKTFIEAYQTKYDKKYNSYSLIGTGFNSSGGNSSIKRLPEEIIIKLIGMAIDGGTIKKIEVDQLNISSYWNLFLSNMKKYKYLEKKQKGTKEIQFYYSIYWFFINEIQKKSTTIINWSEFFDSVFKIVDNTIIELNY